MEETSVKIIRVSSNEDTDGEYSDYVIRAAAEEQSAETFLLETETAADSEAYAATEDTETDGLVQETAGEEEENDSDAYTVHTAATSHALICPGHIDLKITATIRSLNEVSGLYSVDDAGNAVERPSPYPRTVPAGKAGTAE